MSTPPSTLPPEVLSARGLDDVSQAVQVLRDWDTLEAIPHLARHDRRTDGWIFTLTIWLAMSAASLAVMACLLAFLIGVWTVGLRAFVSLANELKPGWGNWTVFIAAIVCMLVLFYDKRFNEAAGQRLGSSSADLIWPLRFGLWCAKLPSYLMMAMIVGSFLAVAMSPLILASLDFGIWLSEQLRQLDKIIVYMEEMWPAILSVTTVIFFAVLGVRSVKKGWVTALNVICIGGWGLLKMLRLSNRLWSVQENVVIGTVLAAALLYRSKLPFILTRPFSLPFHWLYTGARLLTKRVQLRMLLAQAVRAHQKRNAEAVGGEWRTAVCTECLARFEQCSESISYWRRLRYAWCRNCHSDLHCFAGVQLIEGRLDRHLTVAQEQMEKVLQIDMLTRLLPNAPNMPIDLEAIAIADADDEDIEGFIVAYREKEVEDNLQPLKRLGCRIEPNASVSEITMRNLKKAFRHVEASS